MYVFLQKSSGSCHLRAPACRFFSSANPPVRAQQVNREIVHPNALVESTKSLFAVVLYGAEQYKMAPNDVIMLPRLSASIGQEVSFKKCLMVGGERFTAIGRPFLDKVRITAIVEEHKKSHNVIYYLDRHKRKNIQWQNAQNQVSIVRIVDVQYHPEIVGSIDKFSGLLTDD
ncbi:50S ribosomal protein L21 [Perkinsela sp. CCAP 1560/4]|nr:50S ribosomal protein L21 [Perkinsela sp. CCAP 1560/4]|eukprot:KNH09370.1 50S ribosomal protein L21 [Perkinsela sp. CCAP 1560/4]